MSNAEKIQTNWMALLKLGDEIDLLEDREWQIRKDLNNILGPMFAEQEKLAAKIIDEEFLELKHMYHSPYWDLAGRGANSTGYSRSGDTFYKSMEYNDGEHAADVKLLPEFIDGTAEQKEAAVRNFYQSHMDKILAEREKLRLQKIDQAKKLLQEAGVSF